MVPHGYCCLSTVTSVAAAKRRQSSPTLCDPVPGILQARTLEWVTISVSNAWKWKVKVKSLSRVQLFDTPWTAAHQAPPSMGVSRQAYWSGVPLPYFSIYFYTITFVTLLLFCKLPLSHPYFCDSAPGTQCLEWILVALYHVHIQFPWVNASQFPIVNHRSA